MDPSRKGEAARQSGTDQESCRLGTGNLSKRSDRSVNNIMVTTYAQWGTLTPQP